MINDESPIRRLRGEIYWELMELSEWFSLSVFHPLRVETCCAMVEFPDGETTLASKHKSE